MSLISTEEALRDAASRIARSPWAAVDTEADSLHHYREKLCLIQVSIAGADFIIDPLAGLDLVPFLTILAARELFLHGADFDVRLLRRAHAGFKPISVFDTLIAAQLLGYEKQGLADLARRHCDIELSKSAQKADWSLRPLTDKLLDYAAKDTHFLKTIRDALRSELDSKGRLDWHRQSCEKVLEAAMITREKEKSERPEWQIKGSRELSGKALTCLKALWHWREEEASKRDWPRFKVIQDEVLLKIAHWSERHPGVDVASMPGAPRNVRGDLREILNHCVAGAGQEPPSRFVQIKPQGPRPRWGEKENNILQVLKEERTRIASELGIQPAVLVTNAVLEDMILKKPADAQAMAELKLLPWQVDVLSEKFLKKLRGEG